MSIFGSRRQLERPARPSSRRFSSSSDLPTMPYAASATSPRTRAFPIGWRGTPSRLPTAASHWLRCESALLAFATASAFRGETLLRLVAFWLCNRPSFPETIGSLPRAIGRLGPRWTSVMTCPRVRERGSGTNASLLHPLYQEQISQPTLAPRAVRDTEHHNWLLPV